MKIDHAALYVKDLEASRKFFETYFDATSNEMYHNQRTGFSSYFLTFDDGSRLELMNQPFLYEREADQLYGYAHLAFNTGSQENVDSLTQKLLDAGYDHVSGPRWTGDGYYESCILDGEGNRIELTV